MATEAEWKKIAVKAVEDDDFRAAFGADPAEAAASLGITLTPEELAVLEEKKAEAEAVGPREAKGSMAVAIAVAYVGPTTFIAFI
ncbi:MAG: Os1348 family NHLP clan protein [Anaerolineae bacterium]